MSKNSEKSNLSLQEITKHLDENSPAIQEQKEEFRRIQSGASSEKVNLSSANSEASIGNDSSKALSITSEPSFLHSVSPPPSYFDNLRSTSTVESHKSTKLEPSTSFVNRSSSGDYRNLLVKDLRYETRRQLGLHLDLEHPNVKNWKNLADELEFSNLEVSLKTNQFTQPIVTIVFWVITICNRRLHGDMSDVALFQKAEKRLFRK